MSNKHTKLKILELFGGIGAPRMALENLGIKYKSVDYVEILNNAVKAYNAMYDNNYKPQNVLDWNLNVDLLVHGSPCQDFSTAGLNDLSTGRSILYQRTLEIIENVLNPRPKYIIWENVKGLLSNKNILHFEHYLNTLDKLGYKSYSSVLKALEFGIPQTRPRVFIVSIRKDLKQVFDFDMLQRIPMRNILEFLTDVENDSTIQNTLEFRQPSMWHDLERGKVRIITNYALTITTKQIRRNNQGIVFKDKQFYLQDFSLFPKPKTLSGYSLSECKKYFPTYFQDKTYDEIFRYLSPRECWALQGYDTSTTEYKEFSNFYTIPRKSDGQLINGTHNSVWKTDKYIGTITASAVNKIGYIGLDGALHYREITPYESWELQGYKLSTFDRVKATGISDTDMYMLAGNSICVQVLEAIFKELLTDKKSISNKYLVQKQYDLFSEDN